MITNFSQYTLPIVGNDSVASPNTVCTRDSTGSTVHNGVTAITVNTTTLCTSGNTVTASAAVTKQNTLIDATAALVTVTLPAAAVSAWQHFTFVKIDNSHNAVIACTGSDSINGATTTTISTQYGVSRLLSDGVGHFYTV